jgi:hypothetical protein
LSQPAKAAAKKKMAASDARVIGPDLLVFERRRETGPSAGLRRVAIVDVMKRAQ